MRWALRIVQHNVNWCQCLVKTNGDQRQERRSEKIGAKNAELVVEELKNEEDCLSQECTERLKHKNRCNDTNDNRAKRR